MILLVKDWPHKGGVLVMGTVTYILPSLPPGTWQCYTSPSPWRLGTPQDYSEQDLIDTIPSDKPC